MSIKLQVNFNYLKYFSYLPLKKFRTFYQRTINSIQNIKITIPNYSIEKVMTKSKDRKHMQKLIIASNRLPLGLNIEDEEITVTPSVGGLATGMKSVYKQYDSVWIGWPGLEEDNLTDEQKRKIDATLDKERCKAVHLTEEEIEQYYHGFTNNTIWPLFHYFGQYTVHDQQQWESYVAVNMKFAESICNEAKDGDMIWIHDYHLLLVPAMIRKCKPNVTIGFFLHIPFPSYELFRNLPWRNEILEGMLGADLLGFHTFDYERHFLSCVRRLIGYDVDYNNVSIENRISKSEVFPMGIDYDRFQNMAVELQKRSMKDRSKFQQELDKQFLMEPDRKLILSIDRLDYSKGIPNRLRAFERFLEKYPEYKEKVTLIMLTVPSRISVPQYKLLKSEVDELVGSINGKFGSINWTPIWYFYRSLPFENLIELYNSCEMALLTPLRDGMNLVAKEYIASKTDSKGVLILSEMAGAAKELGETIIINPYNIEETADAIKEAYEMPTEQQIEINSILQKRIQRYNVKKWAEDFVSSLSKMEEVNNTNNGVKINEAIHSEIVNKYKKASKRLIFLDYDGTLVGFHKNPKQAIPDEALYSLLDSLSENPKNELVLISGRDKDTFEEWFGNRGYTLITEHGLWLKENKGEWNLQATVDDSWKAIVRPAIEFFVDRTPGTFIEEKNFSLVWHYRKSDPELGQKRSLELKDELTSFIANHNLEILEGNKVIEVKTSGINKGVASMDKSKAVNPDFTICIGDDWTDEYMFEMLPDETISIKVGIAHTKAKYTLKNNIEVRELLTSLSIS